MSACHRHLPTTEEELPTDPEDYDEPDEVPVSYIMVRVTIAHSRWSEIEHVFNDCEWYISYPHMGKKADNEHFHVFIPGTRRSEAEKYRKRLNNLHLCGNKCICAQFYSNGLHKGIQYGSKERSQPIVKGNVNDWIDTAPEWIDTGVRKKQPITEYGIKISCFNLLYKAWEWRKRHKCISTDLPTVLEFMLNSGEYCLCPTFSKGKAPIFYIDIFKESCEVGYLKWNRNILTPNLFAHFKQHGI